MPRTTRPNSTQQSSTRQSATPQTSTPPASSNRTHIWTAAAVVVVALWASGSPALVYPLYERAWALTPAVITTVFAVYPVVLVVVLLVFGSISDYIGRRSAILAGLASIIIGVLIFALAPSVGWLFIGRVFQGIGVGLSLSPAGAALVDFDRTGKRASSINTVAIAVGLTLATVVGGALVQYAPWPRALTFWALLVVAGTVTIAALFLPRHVRGTESLGRWRPRPIRVPRRLRGVVMTATFAVTVTFAVGAIFISLGAQIVKDVLHTDNALIAGSVLAISAAGSGAASIVFRQMQPRTAVVGGGLLGALASGLLIVSAQLSSLPLFVVASVVFGVSSGLLFLGGLGLINENAPAHHRAGTLSFVYLMAYLAQGVVAVGLGVLATSLGLRGGLDIVGPILVALSLAASVVAVSVGKPTCGALTGSLAALRQAQETN